MVVLIVCQPALSAQSPAKSDSPAAVLNPDKFVGKVALGYAAAKEIPEVCAKLFCYCGCDLTDEHSSLLDCFTCDHGVDCTVCQDEAIIALDLKKKGKSLAEIQRAIDDAFQTLYPWEKPSPALKKYRASIIPEPVNPQDNTTTGKSQSLLKLPLHPGSAASYGHLGSCCGHNGG
jgi:hypothetical protein